MKRFYCTICKRARRVRKYPSDVINTQSENVTDRTGTCVWHHPSMSLRSVGVYAGVKASVAKSIAKGGR